MSDTCITIYPGDAGASSAVRGLSRYAECKVTFTLRPRLGSWERPTKTPTTPSDKAERLEVLKALELLDTGG